MSNIEERYASKENLIPILQKINNKLDKLSETSLTKAQIDLLFGETSGTVTVPSQKGTVTYNTESQSPEWNNYDTDKMTIGGTTSGINAGDYVATFTPVEGFKWTDETKTAKEVTWTIGKAVGNITLSKDSVELSDDKESDTVTFSGNTGDVSVSSADMNIAIAGVNGNVIAITKGHPLTLADLPDGAKVKAVGSKWYGKDLIFRKLGAGHSQDPADSVILQTNDIISVRCFDAKEPNNSNADRQNYGNNRYLYSNLLQWLNSDAGANAWYSAQHATDQKPDSANVWQKSDTAVNPYDTQAGFMNGFTADFKNSLLTVTKRTAKNTVTDGGVYEDVQSKFFLLSTTEVGLANENNVAEGELYSLFNDATKRIMVPTQECADNSVGYAITAGSAWYWWLRTPYSSYSFDARSVYPDGSLSNYYAFHGNYGLAPACAISKDQKVSDFVDSDGCYVLLYD